MLKVKQLNDGTFQGGSGFWIAVEFIIDRKDEAFILQDIIRAKLCQYCVESSFGMDGYGENINEVKYVCGKINQLIVEVYNQGGMRVKHMIISKSKSLKS